MTAPNDLEERLRSGLQAAADALPPEPATRPESGAVPLRPHRAVPTRRWVITAVATAASLAAVTVVVTRGDDGDTRGDVSTESSTSSTTSTTEPHVMKVTNGQAPGQGVVQGNQIRLFGPDGQPTGTVDMGALDGTQSASSDLEGGWVVCGSMMALNAVPEGAADDHIRLEDAEGLIEQLDEARAEVEAGAFTVEPSGSTGAAEPPATTTTTGAPPPTAPVTTTTEVPAGTPFVPGQHVSAPQMTWFPADGPPLDIRINGGSPNCSAGGSQVVDSDAGPMVVVPGRTFDPFGMGDGGLTGVVLATGEVRELPAPQDIGQPMPGYWSINSEHIVVYVEGAGFKLFDLETAEPVPMADIDPGSPGETALAPDGKTVAVLVGSFNGPREAMVFDVASGEEVYRHSFAGDAEGDEMSWDGRTLAVGSYYEGEGPVSVFDTTTGAERTIDAWGVVL
jgi:hypothetical protein